MINSLWEFNWSLFISNGGSFIGLANKAVNHFEKGRPIRNYPGFPPDLHLPGRINQNSMVFFRVDDRGSVLLLNTKSIITSKFTLFKGVFQQSRGRDPKQLFWGQAPGHHPSSIILPQQVQVCFASCISRVCIHPFLRD